MRRKLTPKQAMFVKEYLVDLNATQATIRAGYSKRTAREQAARLLSKVNIQEAIQQKQSVRAKRLTISADRIEQEKLSQGSRNWDALYQQRPTPAEGGLIKWAWIRRYRVRPAQPIRIIHSWDTAYKPNQINDPSVCTVWMETKFAYYLVDVWRDWVEYPHLKTAVKSLANKWNATAILIEDKASGQSLIQELRLTTTLPIVAIEPEGDKLIRMSSQSATIEAGNVYLPESSPWLSDYERELFVFPLSEHDDQVDSTSQFLKWVNDNKQQFAYKPVQGCGTAFKKRKGAW